MSIADAFRIKRVVVPPTLLRPGEFRLEGGTPAAVVREGVFVTPQSVASFPGAAAGIEILAKVTHLLIPSLDQNIIRAVWSIIFGFVVFGISIADSWSATASQDKATKCLIALINTAMLFLSAAGVDAVAAGTLPQPPGLGSAPIH